MATVRTQPTKEGESVTGQLSYKWWDFPHGL